MRALFRRQSKPIGAQWLCSSQKQKEPFSSSSSTPPLAPCTSAGVSPTAMLRASFRPINMDTTILAPNRGHNFQEGTTKDMGRDQHPHYSMTSLDVLVDPNLTSQSNATIMVENKKRRTESNEGLGDPKDNYVDLGPDLIEEEQAQAHFEEDSLQKNLSQAGPASWSPREL